MRRIRLGAAGALVAGIGLVGWATAAWATATLTATPSTGITNGQTITLTGSGWTPGSIGNILECNNAPNEPTVALPQPVGNSLAVGCSGVGYIANALTTVSASGTVNKTYVVAQGTLGPPCGKTGDIISTCPATDSAGQSPAADAANYPCPPTPAQQAAGVVCQITFGDQANDSASVNITYQGESTGGPTTTAAPTATTTPTTLGTSATTAPATSPANSLAVTGPGAGLWALLMSGLGLIVLAGGLLLTSRQRWLGAGGRRS